jgi:hypothetical protein
LLRQIVVEATPLRVLRFDQLQFPSTPPFLHAFLAYDRIRHGLVKFSKD